MNLSVNLNKVALLRNSRGADNPSVLRAAQLCIDEGVAGITLHLREDQRHTREKDVFAVAQLCKDNHVEFNLEGDPWNKFLDVAWDVMPTQLTLVPVVPGEITSDHGWDLPRETKQIAPVIEKAKSKGIRTAIFVDPIPSIITACKETNVDRIEIYTEPYAKAFECGDASDALSVLAECVAIATDCNIGVNAGHDLNLCNMPAFVKKVPQVMEVSIGHALIADALYLGFSETIKRYLDVIDGIVVPAPVT